MWLFISGTFEGVGVGGLNREGWFDREGSGGGLIKLFNLPKITVSILHNELEAVLKLEIMEIQSSST